MPSNRLSLRLGQLPHDVLAELAAQLCSDSPALQAAAEECMAAHTPLPHELVERVLLSPDLVPNLLAPLEAEDGAAAAVCSQWLIGWKATNEPRRWLRQVPLYFPGEIDTDGMHMIGTPNGRLVVVTDSEVHILDRSMRVLQTLAGEYSALFAADDVSIFYAMNNPPAVRRASHDGTVDAEYQLEDYHFHCPVLAPGGLLFCVIYEHGGQEDIDEIIALDAQTMQLRHRFGLGLLNDAGQLVVGGDELYVCDTGNDRLQVFSLTGEHRRSITGEWRSPLSLCFAEDRLYLVEQDYLGGADGYQQVRGRRILVLSLQGDILQVVTQSCRWCPAPLQVVPAVFQSICCFDHKLLACYTYSIVGSAGTHTRKYGMLALQGM